MTARLYTLDPLDDFRPKTFAGHRSAVLNAYFSSNSKSVNVICDSTMYPIDHCDAVRYTLSAVMVLCSSGEPRRPTTLMMITCQHLQIARLLMFVGGFINDITSINPIQRLFAVLFTGLQDYSSSGFHPGFLGSGRCQHSQTCIY